MKAKYRIFLLGLLINHIQIDKRGLSASSKRVYLFAEKGRPFLIEKVDPFGEKGRRFSGNR